mgnify:CR=1 FL=1
MYILDPHKEKNVSLRSMQYASYIPATDVRNFDLIKAEHYFKYFEVPHF